jgi:integrase
MKNTRDKAIMLVAASSGLRPETLFSLNVGDVEFTFNVRREMETEKVEDIGRIHITPGPGRKVKSAYYTHITSEAIEMLQQYLDERTRIGEAITDKSPLWLTHFDLLADKKNKRPLNRLSCDTFSLQWRRILKRAEKDKKSYAEGESWFWHKFHLKTLRKFFRTEATNARCIEDLKYFWMGQPGGVHRPEYYKERVDVSVDEYRRLMPFLTVEKPIVAVKQEDLDKRDKQIERLKQQIENMQEQNLQLKQRLNGHMLSSDQVSELLRRIEKLEKQAQQTS